MNGDIDNIKKMSLKGINLDEGFTTACRYGHYKVVQYLVELHKNDSAYKPIDIHSGYEFGFEMACRNGHYDIVRFLIELYRNDDTYKSINIHENTEWGFRWAWYNGHYKIIHYLLKLTKKHTVYNKPFNNYLMIFKKFNKYKL